MATMAASQGLPGLPASSVLTWCSSITFHAAKSLFRHHQDHPNPAPLLLPKTILPIGQMLLPLGFLQFDWTQVWFSLEQSWLQGHVCCCQSRTLKLQIDSIGEVISVLVLQVWNTYPLRAWAKWKKKRNAKSLRFCKSLAIQPAKNSLYSPNPISSWTSGAIRLFIQLRPGLW